MLANIDFTPGRGLVFAFSNAATYQMNTIEQYTTLTTIKIFITSFIGFLICSPSSNQFRFVFERFFWALAILFAYERKLFEIRREKYIPRPTFNSSIYFFYTPFRGGFFFFDF